MTTDGVIVIKMENKIISEFENILLKAKAKALSKISLERPLNDKELEKYKEVCGKLGITL